MGIKIEQSSCGTCGKVLDTDWYFCSHCGSSRQNFFVQCSQCHRPITEANANYCPYCRFKLQKVYEAISYSTNAGKSELPAGEILNNPITISVLANNLKFNPLAMKQILFSNRFSILSILLILLYSVTGAMANYFTSRIYYFGPYITNSLNYNSFFWDITVLFITVLTFGFIYNTLLNFIHVKEENMNFIRMMGSYFPIFLVKDSIIIMLGVVIGSDPSEGNNRFTILNLNVLLIILIILFVFFHLLFTTIKNTQLGAMMTIITIFMCFLVSFLVGYLLPTTIFIYTYN